MIVDFVLVIMVLVPLVLGLIQVGLVLNVHNTLAAAATEGFGLRCHHRAHAGG